MRICIGPLRLALEVLCYVIEERVAQWDTMGLSVNEFS